MDNLADREISLVGHLDELRSRLIICLIAVTACIAGAFFVAKPILGLLTRPIQGLSLEPGRAGQVTFMVGRDGMLKLDHPQATRAGLAHLSQKRFQLVWPADPGQKLPAASMEVGEGAFQKFYYSNPIDPIMMQFKVALILGLLLGLPIFLWHTWRFIQPGLTRKEREITRPLLVGAVFLFPLGAAFAYYMVILVLKIMQVYAVQNISPLLNIFQYLSLLSNMMLIFGVIFEIPLILAIGSRVGLVTPQFLQTYRRHAYVVLSLGAMVITPGGDPVTMIVALLPLIALYELSIMLAKPMARLHQKELSGALGEDPAS